MPGPLFVLRGGQGPAQPVLARGRVGPQPHRGAKAAGAAPGIPTRQLDPTQGVEGVGPAAKAHCTTRQSEGALRVALAQPTRQELRRRREWAEGLGREANEAYNDFVSQRSQLMGRSALVVP